MSQTLVDWLFDPAGLTAHGFCLLWDPGLIWLHAFADFTTGLSYFSIPLALAIFARRRQDLMFRGMFLLFAAFIVLCGTGHWLDLLTLWVPAYGIEGIVKAATALVSVTTAFAIWRMLPHALALPSHAQLQTAEAAVIEARHKAAFDESPVPLHTLDGRGVITSVSQSWLSLFGYKPLEVLGHSIDEFAAPGSPTWQEEDGNQALSAVGDGDHRQRRFLRADGSIVDTLVLKRLERADAVVSISCVVIDLTAVKRAEAALRESDGKLTRALRMESIGQLTSGIAHDFNNLLGVIIGNAEFLADGVRDDPAKAKLAEEILASAESGSQLTRRLLAFARRQPLQPAVIDLNDHVSQQIVLLGRILGDDIVISTDLAPALWPTHADVSQVGDALLNLAINARDAMPKGGRLTIRTENISLQQDDAAETAAGDYVVLSVSDTGLGMAPAVMARACEPFFTTKPAGKGTGLGLSMIYGFACQSGGTLEIDSAIGVGTTMRLFLPRAFGEAASPGEPADLGIVIGGRESVLLVDDNASVQSVTARHLDTLGYTVRIVGNGPEALEALQSSERFDLLFTDLTMPGGMNGLELADIALRLFPDLAILVTSGSANGPGENSTEGMRHRFLPKPYHRRELADAVHAALQQPARDRT